MGLDPLPHIAIFPFMSKGHTIPLFHLAHLISHRRLATLTFFTTPLNADFLRRSLFGTGASVVELPFPHDASGLPSGVESTDRLPSLSYFVPFVRAVKKIQPQFEMALQSLLPSVSLLISDGFFGWTNESASKLGIPRIVFYGMGNFATAITAVVIQDFLDNIPDDRYQLFTVPRFPDIWLTRADLGLHFSDSSHMEFVEELAKATRESRGVVVNSFYEMESEYNDCWNSQSGPKAWCVGPLCLARPEAAGGGGGRSPWIKWLDSRLEMNRPVLYVAFGTQAEMSRVRMEEIAAGLEGSGVDFLWVVRAAAAEEEEVVVVGERGMVVKEWVDQAEILAHESVRGFMSHCGWNSVMEAVAAGVPILAHPMMAEQHLNAILVVEVLGIGLRVRRIRDQGMVRREEVQEMARELLLGEKGKEAAGKVRELAGEARKAVDDGGSSWRTLEQMIDEVCKEE